MPKRLRSPLSTLVYRNPPMPVVRVVEALEALEAAGLEAWVMGGWGLDALAGKQFRPHRDLDLIVEQGDMAAALSVLSGLGFEEWHRHPPSTAVGNLEPSGDNVVVRDEGMRVVDLHAFSVRDSGQRFAIGTIGGLRVKCLTVQQQLVAQYGYRKRLPGERRSQRRNMQIVRRLAEQRVEPNRPGT